MIQTDNSSFEQQGKQLPHPPMHSSDSILVTSNEPVALFESYVVDPTMPSSFMRPRSSIEIYHEPSDFDQHSLLQQNTSPGMFMDPQSFNQTPNPAMLRPSSIETYIETSRLDLHPSSVQPTSSLEIFPEPPYFNQHHLLHQSPAATYHEDSSHLTDVSLRYNT